MQDSIDYAIVRPFSFVDDELKEELNRVSVKVSATLSSENDNVFIVDTKKTQVESEFISNYSYWNKESTIKSVDNFVSGYFDAIVNMKEDAVPYIYRELQKGPTPLVHALDIIYEGEVEYDGYLPLDFVCNVWLEILKTKGISV